MARKYARIFVLTLHAVAAGSQKHGALPKRHDNSLFFSLLKTMLKLIWPLLIVNLFKIRKLLSYLAILDELRARYHAGSRRPIFGAKLEAWRDKILHIFLFLQTDRVFGTVNPFS